MTLRTALASVAILLSVCACSGPAKEKKQEKVKAPVEAEPESDTFDSGLPAPQYVTDVKKMQILSITDTLYRGDTLKIKFKTPHYQDLGIRTPDDKFFFAVFSGLDSGKPSLVDYSAFAEIDQLEIITDKTKLNPWNATIPKNQIAFTMTGNYEVELSESLDTDDGSPVEVKKVYYINRPRSK